MNKTECDILIQLAAKKSLTQRELSQLCKCSLGNINNSLKKLRENNYINDSLQLTNTAWKLLNDNRPKSAIILAAGFGLRMIPINRETPKGLLEIHGEPLVERLIKQLKETGIYKIYIVTGFLKEQYEYLIDKYQIELIVNTDYASKNNMHSLQKAAGHLSSSYIIPCDIWCAENPFGKFELYSWYMVSPKSDKISSVRINRKQELIPVKQSLEGNTMIGICYLNTKDSYTMTKELMCLCSNSAFDDKFWEFALFHSNTITVFAKIAYDDKVLEINTYEQLRSIDSNSNQLKSDAILTITHALHVNQNRIQNITTLKKGMTNRSFLFSCQGQKYIMRIPGEGTGQIISRANEAKVYQQLQGKNICDHVLYINEQNGYKITEYMENSRICDANNEDDTAKCMLKLRQLHELKLHTDHDFNLFEQICFYESLRDPLPSVYKDYAETKEHVFSLKTYIDAYAEEKVLAHIDAVPDNFLFVRNDSGTEQIYLIDWEYAGMQDPHIDIAMFAIYAFYDRQHIDRLIDLYFQGSCTRHVKIKIYCYVAACGLLWSNWCEYKRSLGIDFGEYSLKQYRYAKEYYRIAAAELGKECTRWDIK